MAFFEKTTMFNQSAEKSIFFLSIRHYQLRVCQYMKSCIFRKKIMYSEERETPFCKANFLRSSYSGSGSGPAHPGFSPKAEHILHWNDHRFHGPPTRHAEKDEMQAKFRVSGDSKLPTQGLLPTLFRRSYSSLRSSGDMVAKQPMTVNTIIKNSINDMNLFIISSLFSGDSGM
jgi:hypothetical protein